MKTELKRELTLQDLAPYLPYGLMCQIGHPYIPYRGNWDIIGIEGKEVKITKDETTLFQLVALSLYLSL